MDKTSKLEPEIREYLESLVGDLRTTILEEKKPKWQRKGVNEVSTKDPIVAGSILVHPDGSVWGCGLPPFMCVDRWIRMKHETLWKKDAK